MEREKKIYNPVTGKKSRLTKAVSGLVISVFIIPLFISLLALTATVPETVQAVAPGFIAVSGYNFTVGGAPMTIPLVGVDETTAVTMAIRAHCEGITGELGKNMNFPVPDTGKLTVNSLAHLWYAYFWFCDWYGIDLVRMSSGDDYSTKVCYEAWKNHPTQYFQVLEEMLKQAYSFGVYVDLNMAGSQEYPLYNFGETDSVFDLDNTSGHAYYNYLQYLNATMSYCDGSAYTNAIFSYDVWNEPDHNLVNTGYWAGNQVAFRTWAKEVANDTTVMSTHIVEMGVAGQSNLFGWGYGSFLNATGSVGFDVFDRHYYASIETDDYLVHDPVGWANTCGKPLVWSELAKGTSPLTRWTWFETELRAHGAMVWCNMVLRGTTGYPYIGDYPFDNDPPSSPPSGRLEAYFDYTLDGSTVKFHDNSTAQSSSVVGWLWNFGDGTSSFSKDPVHTYPKEGTYMVTLQVTTSSGMKDAITRKVIIEPQGPPAGDIVNDILTGRNVEILIFAGCSCLVGIGLPSRSDMKAVLLLLSGLLLIVWWVMSTGVFL